MSDNEDRLSAIEKMSPAELQAIVSGAEKVFATASTDQIVEDARTSIQIHEGVLKLKAERDKLQAIVNDFAAIYRDVWGADDKKDADVCIEFERVILRHNL